MKKNRSLQVLSRACIALSVLLGVVLSVTPALAEALSVSGADHFYSADATDDSVDILTVTGQTGDTVYVNMAKEEKGGTVTLASHLAFTLTDDNAEVDANGDMVGAVSVEFNAQAFSYDDTYSIEVFADREEKSLLYEGTVSTIFAQYGNAAPQALVVRTLAKDEQRPLSVPQTQAYQGVGYKLVGEDPVDVDGRQCYVYEEDGELAESVDAHITYYDIENPTADPIKTQTVTLAKGTSQDVAIESIVSAEGNDILYRSLQLADKVTAAYPGTTEYAIMCKALSEEWGKQGSFYKAKIQYTDAEGNSLGFKDTVIVNKKYTYTAPSILYVRTGETVQEYAIQDASKAKLQLEPGDAEGEATYDIVYEPVADDAERTWTVVLENGSVSPKDSKRVIERITYKGRPGDSAVHTTKEKITVDGVDYVPTAAAQDSYTHTFGVADMEVEQTIYYVPDGYVAPEAYDVTVKYVNIATNEVIDSETYTASPSMRQDLEISSPESFTQGGIEWIRLNGQESPIRHGFYSPAREYVVYYRDINDDLHVNTIIRTVRVVYVDEEGNTVTRPATIVDNGTTTTAAPGAGATTTEGAGTEDTEEGGAEAIEAVGADPDAPTETGLTTGADLIAIDGEDGQDLVAGDGTDLATMRIDDDETPLASLSGEDAASKLSPEALAIGGIGAAVAAGLFLFFVFKRRKQGKDESSEDELKA